MDSIISSLVIRDEIGERVKRRWWRSGEIDKSRWQMLDSLIEKRIQAAKDNLTKSLLTELRELRDDTSLSATARGTRAEKLDGRIWRHLENGELDEAQQNLLGKVLKDVSSGESKASKADTRKRKKTKSVVNP